MKLTAVIDRFEAGKAVLLLRDGGGDEIPVVWPKSCLPAAKEGDVLSISCDVDEAATREALSENERILNELLARQKQKM